MECNVYKSVKDKVINSKKIEKIVLSILKKNNKKNALISVHIVGDKKMKRLNLQYLGKDRVTDVLTFAVQNNILKGNNDLGDIFICLPQINRQAKFFKKSIKEEFIRMLVHGLLHALGFSHNTKKKAKIMLKKQEDFVKKYMKEI